ncbi:unnamed protein product [Cercospora beticola]|nr:unnamed protein product [Cercospora beticola]
MTTRRYSLSDGNCHQKLSSKSAAYQQYYMSVWLPESAPCFDFDVNGYPVVEIGEVFCRWPRRAHNERGGICGRRLTTRNDLLRHIEEKHGVDRQHRPKSVPYHDGEACERANAFYRALMNYTSRSPERKGHTFVDHFVAERMTPEEDVARGATSPTWSGDSIAAEPREDDHLDEEDIGPAVEDNNFTVEENGFTAGEHNSAVTGNDQSMKNNSSTGQENDVDEELEELEAEIAMDEVHVKRLEAEQRLMEKKLRKRRLLKRKSAMEKAVNSSVENSMLRD